MDPSPPDDRMLSLQTIPARQDTVNLSDTRRGLIPGGSAPAIHRDATTSGGSATMAV
jgi:hypothetical protein